MNRLLRIGALLSVALTLGCGPVFYVEAEEPSVCKTITGQTVPGNLAGGTATWGADYDYDFGSELLNFGDKKVDTQLRLEGVTFTATSGVTDIHFVDSGDIKITDPTGTLPPQTVLSYQKSGSEAPGPVLEIQQGDTVDVTQYLNAGSIHVHAELTGQLPTNDWTMDVKACLYTKIHYDYL